MAGFDRPLTLESVYQKALAHELNKAGLQVEAGKLLPVYYEEIVVGEFPRLDSERQICNRTEGRAKLKRGT